MSTFNTTKLQSPTGASLHLLWAQPDTPPKAIVQINHGMAEHAARYDRFAADLIAAGYAVTAHDHRGHGHTIAQDAHLGQFGTPNGFEKVIDDVVAVNDWAREKWRRTDGSDLPVICFGHSMGAFIAFNFAIRKPERLDAVAVWNSSFDTGFLAVIFGLILKIERMFKGSDVPSAMAQKLTFDAWNSEFKPNRTDFDWLSRDESAVDAYVADTLCGFPVTVGLWLDLLGAIHYAANDNNLTHLPKNLPVHLLAGAKDPCTLNGEAMKRFHARLEKAGIADLSLTILEETRHESLNEINREETISAFVQWLDVRFGQPLKPPS